MIDESKIIIRDAEASDYSTIGAIRATNSAETYDDRYIDYRFLELLTEANCEEQARNYDAAIGNETIVVEVDGEVVGYAAGRPSPDVLGAFWLEYLGVEMSLQGQGLGQQLIAAMMERVRAGGYGQMVVDVFAGNDKAEGIYRHLGAEVLQENFMQDVDGFLIKSKLLAWSL